MNFSSNFVAQIIEKWFLQNPYFWLYNYLILLEIRYEITKKFHSANFEFLKEQKASLFIKTQLEIFKAPLSSIVLNLRNFPDLNNFSPPFSKHDSWDFFKYLYPCYRKTEEDENLLLKFLVRLDYTFSFIQNLKFVVLILWFWSLNFI